MQGEASIVPEPLLVKFTSPLGAVGAADVSVTVAVQVDATPTFTEEGEHVTAVLVLSIRAIV